MSAFVAVTDTWLKLTDRQGKTFKSELGAVLRIFCWREHFRMMSSSSAAFHHVSDEFLFWFRDCWLRAIRDVGVTVLVPDCGRVLNARKISIRRNLYFILLKFIRISCVFVSIWRTINSGIYRRGVWLLYFWGSTILQWWWDDNSVYKWRASPHCTQ